MIFAQQNNHQQQGRHRKEVLVPKATDDEMMEVLGVIGDYTNVMSVESGRYIEIASSPDPSEDHEGSGAKPRKRAKLDHLSSEEKAQHRKMMNRISAQSARDRQKAQMQQQEITIKNMSTVNENLKKENTSLSLKCEKLTEENERLSQLLKEYEEKFQKLHSGETAEVKVKTEPPASSDSSVDAEESGISSSLEPAVPRTIPLPKGQELLRNFSCIPTLLWICLVWTLTHPSSSKLLKTSLSKSSALETNSPLGLKKQCGPSLELRLRNQLSSMALLSKRIREPG